MNWANSKLGIYYEKWALNRKEKWSQLFYMFHLEQCFIVEVSIFGIFWKIHLPTICIEYFWCAKQYVLLVWDSSLLLSIWAVSGSFQKLKAGLLESFKETQCLFILKMWVTLNSIFSACFFHSSEHLWLGPYHPMVFPSLSSMANDHWGQLSLKKKNPSVTCQDLRKQVFDSGPPLSSPNLLY